ncbi:MAG: hypothetical protein J6M39_01925 [Lachnospiraceae bacterium]|nr:hypothetical protein [Lachnospiraceae bacterium]
MSAPKNKKIIAKILAYIGLLIILLFIIGMIYGLVAKDGMFVIAMIIGLSIVSLLYRWGIMAFKKIYGSDNVFKDENNNQDITKITNINTKKL